MEDPIIELVGAEVRSLHQPTAQVEEVNWQVRSGDFWVVGGLPGTGKTDLLLTAGGLLRPGQGAHRMFGLDTGNLSEWEQIQLRRRVGMVFSYDARLFAELTVMENLALPYCYHNNLSLGEADEAVSRVLEWVELSEVATERPVFLQRSWRQRLGLARALMLDPEVLLLDNPLTGLDPVEVQWWRGFLRELSSGGGRVGRSVTLVAVADDFQPWLGPARQFAVVEDRHFRALGGELELRPSGHPLVRALWRGRGTDSEG